MKNQTTLSSVNKENGGSQSKPAVWLALFAVAFLLFAPTILSAQAAKIVFARENDSANPDTYGIWTMNADGTNRVRITNVNGHDFPAFSNDGRKIVFYDAVGLAVMNADGSNIARIWNGSVQIPTFSPDGTKIVFTGTGNPFRQLYVINANGSNVQQISSGDTNVVGSTWSPDGTRIVYAALNAQNNYQLYSINPDGTNKVNLTAGTQNFEIVPSFSPDGSTLVFQSNDQRLATRSSTAIGGLRTLFTAQGTPGNYSPDGGKIVYRGLTGGIYTMNADGTSQTQLSTSAADRNPRFYTPSVRRVKFDFDGDGKSEMLVFRPSNGFWYSTLYNAPTTQFRSFQWGASGDVPLPADRDGDGKTDYTVARPSGNQYLIYTFLTSTNTAQPVEYYGGPQLNDAPVIGDFDGDGRDDLTVARYGTTPFQQIQWITKLSSTGQYKNTEFFGAGFDLSGVVDIPFAEDMDGDGKADLVVRRRSGEWFARLSATGSDRSYGVFGFNTDLPALADYDGDGKTDLAVYRPSTRTMYINRSTAGYASFFMSDSQSTLEFPTSGVVPAPADYDGDGKADPTVVSRANGLWLILLSSNNQFSKRQWGASSDAIPAQGVSALGGQ